MQRTRDVVTRQITAMSASTFEVGLFKREAERSNECAMIPRTWDVEHVLNSIAWMRLQNLGGRNIYVRPAGEHNLTLIDDLKANSLHEMSTAGFQPALVVETSPDNFQAWLKHPRALSRDVSTAAARKLAEQFGGDVGAADWRHFGRLAGFTNRKAKYQSAEGLFPFVRLRSATGRVYEKADQFILEVESRVKKENKWRQERQMFRLMEGGSKPARSIEHFRSNPAYAGDKTRSDFAYAIYALSHGVGESEVAQALRSRDLTHKGNEKRQNEYIDRTIRKAMAVAGRGECLTR